jgi:hypothetical protein
MRLQAAPRPETLLGRATPRVAQPSTPAPCHWDEVPPTRWARAVRPSRPWRPSFPLVDVGGALLPGPDASPPSRRGATQAKVGQRPSTWGRVLRMPQLRTAEPSLSLPAHESSVARHVRGQAADVGGRRRPPHCLLRAGVSPGASPVAPPFAAASSKGCCKQSGFSLPPGHRGDSGLTRARQEGRGAWMATPPAGSLGLPMTTKLGRARARARRSAGELLHTGCRREYRAQLEP